MIENIKHIFLGLLCLLFILPSCRTLQRLEPDQSLVRSHQIVFDSTLSRKEAKQLELELSLLISGNQIPNKKILWTMRPRLWWWYKVKNDSDSSKFARWIRKNVAEAPRLYNPKASDDIAQSMTYYMQSKGYFNATVKAKAKAQGKDNKLTDVSYYITPNRPVLIQQIKYDCPDTAVLKILNQYKYRAALQAGKALDISLYDQDKLNIVKLLRNEGYAYFAQNFINILDADTINHSKNPMAFNRANVVFSVLLPPNGGTHQAYKIGQIKVYPSFNPGQKQLHDSLVGGVHFMSLSGKLDLKAETILDNMYFKSGELYRQSNYEKTLAQLENLGLHRFISVRYEIDEKQKDLINIVIQMNPSKKMALEGGVELNYSNATLRNTVGTAANANFKHRNLFRGAELLSSNLAAGVEMNIEDQRFAYDIKAGTDLSAPKFIDIIREWKLLRKTGIVNQKFYNNLKENGNTRIGVSFNYLKLLDFYQYNLFTATYGYDVRDQHHRYSINQMGINYFLPSTEARFDSIALIKQFLRKSFSKQFFTGFFFKDFRMIYTSRTNQAGETWYSESNIEQSGMEVYAVNSVYNAFALQPKVFKLFKDIDFSKYIRLEQEGRYTRNFGSKRSLVVRGVLGAIFTYGDSVPAPYVKQFYLGGPSSLRAWRIRTVGPGAHYDPSSNDPSSNTPGFQTGDLKFEFNVEYRFPVFWRIESALFLDGGNIWTLKSDASRPDAKISQSFYKQIALGTGLGIRLDFNFFIFRFDLGYRVRNPYKDPDTNSYWAYTRFDALKINDINYNLAIGYPF